MIVAGTSALLAVCPPTYDARHGLRHEGTEVATLPSPVDVETVDGRRTPWNEDLAGRYDEGSGGRPVTDFSAQHSPWKRTGQRSRLPESPT